MGRSFKNLLSVYEKNFNKKVLIEILDESSQYLIVNKPSGVMTEGTKSFKGYILPQLLKVMKEKACSLQPKAKIDPSQFKIIHRLDRFVTGGIVVARGVHAKHLSNAFAPTTEKSYSIKRRYVGLLALQETKTFRDHIRDLPHAMIREEGMVRKLKHSNQGASKGLIFVDRTLNRGYINYDITIPYRDDRKKSRSRKTSTSDREFISYNAKTKFLILHSQAYQPLKALVSHFPDLYKGKKIYPIILELETGKKNQIRDHILQAFKLPLLNDDNFENFKHALLLSSANLECLNSHIFTSNQIGLHSAWLQVSHKDQCKKYLTPIPEPDRLLWTGFLRGSFLKPHINRSLESEIFVDV